MRPYFPESLEHVLSGSSWDWGGGVALRAEIELKTRPSSIPASGCSWMLLVHPTLHFWLHLPLMPGLQSCHRCDFGHPPFAQPVFCTPLGHLQGEPSQISSLFGTTQSKKVGPLGAMLEGPQYLSSVQQNPDLWGYL